MAEREFNEKPVFLFTGFLGGGKTTFIQDTMETPDFNGGEETLLLICERGEQEYLPDRFADNEKVHIEYIKSETDLTGKTLMEISKRYRFDRIMIEYNGMWMLKTLFTAMPQGWIIAQEMTFFDAGTFLMFNKNMRQQCFDKLKTAELVIFNRCVKGFDKMPFHKEVRVANRRSQILYEYGPYDVEPDDIADPLPYDIEQSKIEIKDEWYAEWYRDINENEDAYDGKVLTLRGRAALVEDLPDGQFAFGRHVMTCCIEDVQFAGLMAIYAGTEDFHTGDWLRIKAKVRIEYCEAYGEKGPVLYCRSVERTEPAEPEIASFI